LITEHPAPPQKNSVPETEEKKDKTKKPEKKKEDEEPEIEPLSKYRLLNWRFV
jgi:hypothetical protein